MTAYTPRVMQGASGEARFILSLRRMRPTLRRCLRTKGRMLASQALYPGVQPIARSLPAARVDLARILQSE